MQVKQEVLPSSVRQMPPRPTQSQDTCRWCAKGQMPNFLDEDGTLCAVSGRSGILSHAWDDKWWPCLKFGRALRYDAPAGKREIWTYVGLLLILIVCLYGIAWVIGWLFK